MFTSELEQLTPTTYAEAAAGAGDLPPVLYGMIMLLAMGVYALISSTVKQVKRTLKLIRETFKLLMQELRTLFFAFVVAMLVAALVLLAFADLLAQG